MAAAGTSQRRLGLYPDRFVQGIRVGQRPSGIIQLLRQDEADQAAKTAATPAAVWS